MLLLVAATERFVARHDLDFTTVVPQNWKYSDREARRATEPGSVLCFGTSLVKLGVVSRVIEQQTGRPALNLAVCGGHMPSSYFLLKRALVAGARPAAVVVDCQEGPVPREPAGARAPALSDNLRLWPELLTWAECVGLAVAARDADFFAETAVAKLLPSFKARFEVRANVMVALRDKTGSSRIAMVALRRNWRVNRGTQVVPRQTAAATTGGDVEPTGPDAKVEPLSVTRFRQNHLTDLYTRRFLNLAASRNIPVFWVLMPLGPGHQRRRDSEGVTAYHDAQAREVLTAFPNVTVVDGRRSRYPADVFYDNVHLDRQGACTLSSDLGAVLSRTLAAHEQGRAAERWVSLLDFRPRPFSVVVEDVMESCLAGLAGTGKVVR
jgi:hypothetical protein